MQFESKQLLKCPGTGGGTALERGRGPFHKACDDLAGISCSALLVCLFVDNPGDGSHVIFFKFRLGAFALMTGCTRSCLRQQLIA